MTVESVNAFASVIDRVYLQPRIKYSPHTTHLLLLLGNDFDYVAAGFKLDIIDRFVEALNKNTVVKVKALYSTPSKYFQSVMSEKPKLSTYSIDFLNYDERLMYLHPGAHPDAVDNWVGYYASNSELKT